MSMLNYTEIVENAALCSVVPYLEGTQAILKPPILDRPTQATSRKTF